MPILACTVAASSVRGAGLDRSGQSIDLLFETGNHAEVSLGYVHGWLDGTDRTGRDTGNIARAVRPVSAGLKLDLTPATSMALIYDQPYGAGVLYNANSVFQSAVNGATTIVRADSEALTLLGRHRLGGGFSVHGGVRLQRIDGAVGLRGAAYGGLDGYSVRFSQDRSVGLVLGGAYEVPDIALRFAFTYSSPIGHSVDTEESFSFGAIPAADSETPIVSPPSLNLDFRTGIAENTLLFASVRMVAWNGFDITPRALFNASGGSSLVSYSHDGHTYRLGLGHRFSTQWAGAVQLGYEDGNDGLISTLGPTDGFWSAGLAASYTLDAMRITLGARYIAIGDANAAVGGQVVGRFRNNAAVAVGVKLGYRF